MIKTNIITNTLKTVTYSILCLLLMTTGITFASTANNNSPGDTLQDAVTTPQAATTKYDISLIVPIFQNNADTNYDKLNSAITNIQDTEKEYFDSSARRNYKNLTTQQNSLPNQDANIEQNSTIKPTLDLQNKLSSTYQITRDNTIVSIVMRFEGYNSPAAHPYHTIRTINYDTKNNTIIELSSLFKDNSNYLSALSKIAYKKLQEQGTPATETLTIGTRATSDNFKYWTIDKSGINLYFPEYQVASYAEGEKVVTIKASELSTILIDTNFSPKEEDS
jgi:hypothetical protein